MASPTVQAIVTLKSGERLIFPENGQPRWTKKEAQRFADIVMAPGQTFKPGMDVASVEVVERLMFLSKPTQE